LGNGRSWSPIRPDEHRPSEFGAYSDGPDSRARQTPTSWSKDHIAITWIFSIGATKSHSLCDSLGSQFWIDEWGYPAIGVYFADCPSAGHDMLCLDYRACGPHGEPRVVHIDQEIDYRITVVAESFAAFLNGREDCDAFA
jgi:hypothetical protein